MGCGRKRRASTVAAGAAIVASVLAGCGQRGPLVLPSPPPEPPPRAAPPAGSVVLQPARPATPEAAPAAGPTDDTRRPPARRTD